jgi:hypothetical protein
MDGVRGCFAEQPHQLRNMIAKVTEKIAVNFIANKKGPVLLQGLHMGW